MSDIAYGWIEWKHIDNGMEVECQCGHHFWILTGGNGSIECPKCEAIYWISGRITLERLDSERLKGAALYGIAQTDLEEGEVTP